MAQEREELKKTNAHLNEAIQIQKRKSQSLIEKYKGLSEENTALRTELETKDSRIKQFINEAKIKESRITQLTDANKMLKYRHELLMIELKKKREWFQLCSNSLKAKGSTHALNYLAKIEDDIKNRQAALFCPDASEHKAPDVAAKVRWTDLESGDEPDIDEKTNDMATTD